VRPAWDLPAGTHVRYFNREKRKLIEGVAPEGGLAHPLPQGAQVWFDGKTARIGSGGIIEQTSLQKATSIDPDEALAKAFQAAGRVVPGSLCRRGRHQCQGTSRRLP
jgi:hypothetical protein